MGEDRAVAVVTGAAGGMGAAIILIASSSADLIARPLIDRAIREYLSRGCSRIVDLMLRSPQTAHPVSKRAVSYALAMATLCGERGVRILPLSPGIIDTEMGRPENDTRPQMGNMVALTPIRRTAQGLR